MAGAQVSIDVSDEELRAFMARLGREGTGDLVPRLGEYLEGSTKARFDKQASPEGVAWEKLQPRYAKRKAAYKDKILILSGQLRLTIRYQRIDETTAAVGTNLPYGAIHQFGGTIQKLSRQATLRLHTVSGRKLFASKKQEGAVERQVTIEAHEVKIPARPYLGFSAEDRSRFTGIVREWVQGT